MRSSMCPNFYGVMIMWSTKVWRNLPSRVGFYTKETRDYIPESSGIYAWFVPLHLYNEDCLSFIQLIQSFYLYDASTRSNDAIKSVGVDFVWDSVSIDVKKCGKYNLTGEMSLLWTQMLNDLEQRKAFERALLEATILMPPLYVGKADDLKARYAVHTGIGDPGENNFQNRFTRFALERKLGLRVSDLLFVCIRTDPDVSQVLRKSKLNKLLEQLMLRLARPPFSMR